PIQVIENIRLASIEEIVAMKFDIISRGGRKKDFWDIHALIDLFQPEEMIGFFKKRYPFYDDLPHLKEMLLFFDKADEDWDPMCLLGKHWELIKLDLYEYFLK
ncbi:MAG: nucleotidyl transferase AbiEii/AbiGii toxin family protein, partial [Saprospiraceae bacterium]